MILYEIRTPRFKNIYRFWVGHWFGGSIITAITYTKIINFFTFSVPYTSIISLETKKNFSLGKLTDKTVPYIYCAHISTKDIIIVCIVKFKIIRTSIHLSTYELRLTYTYYTCFSKNLQIKFFTYR